MKKTNGLPGAKFTLVLLLLISFQFNGIAQSLNAGKYITTASGLKYKILKKGKGAKAKSQYRLFINYVSKINMDSSVFDSNPEKGKPYAFILGEEEGLKGWDEALALLNVGDSAHFIIPSSLAYGSKKIGKIPANSSVQFYVKLITQQQAYFATEKKDSVMLQGVKKYLVQASTQETVKPYELVSMNFTGYILNAEGKKRIFQSSLSNSNKAIFQLGVGRMVRGLDLGIASMRVGEKATFIIPPDLGFGSEKNGIIPANSTLYYDIEVLSSKDPFFHATSTDTLYDNSGIKLVKIVSAEGEKIATDKVVTLHCLNYFMDSLGHRIIFSSTYENNQPMIVRCGSKSGFPGLNKAIANLKKGEKATVITPSALAYGKAGKGIVPPNTSLMHDVEILDIKAYPFFNTNGKDTVKTLTGLKYVVVNTYSGSVAGTNDEVGVAYTGFVMDSLGNKLIFDTSRENGRLLDFTLGQESMIKGMDEGVHGMAVGDARRLIVPYELAYGEKGVPEAGIPAKTDLYFDIELVRLKLKTTENPSTNQSN